MSTQLRSAHIYYGIIILVVLAPLVFFPNLINLYRLPKIAFISLWVTLLIWLWLFLLIQEKREKPAFPLAIPFILYLSISALSLIQAINLFEGIFALSQKFTYIFLFWLVVNHLKTKEKMEAVLLWNMGAAFVVSLVGIYQSLGGDIPRLVNLASPGSTFGNKNMAAQYILLTLPFPYMFFLSARERQKERLFAICAATLSTYLLYTGTRAAWAGCGAAIFAITFSLRVKRSLWDSQSANFKAAIWEKKIALGCIVLFAVLMNWIPPYVIPDFQVHNPSPAIKRFSASALELDQDTSLLNRLAMWANTLEMFKDHPLLGVGKGNFKILYSAYAGKKIRDPVFSSTVQPREAHNDYIELLAETGIFGLLSFALICVLIALKSWQSIPGKNDPYRAKLILALSFSFIALLVEASLDFPFEIPVSEAFFWLLSGLLWIACEQNSLTTNSTLSTENKTESARWRALLPPPTVLVGLLAGLSILIAAMNLTFLRAEFHFSRGVRLANEDQLELATQEISKAEFLNPTTYKYPFFKGLVFLRLGRYGDAVQANLRTLSLHPYYINAYTNLGVAYASAGKIKEAEWAWKRALEIWPDHNDARYDLATIYSLYGRKKEAIALFREALQRNPKEERAKQKLEILLRESTQEPQ